MSATGRVALALALVLWVLGGAGARAFASAPAGSAANPHGGTSGIDARVLDERIAGLLTDLEAGAIDSATARAAVLARDFPDFALGKLLYAELESVAAMDPVWPSRRDGWPSELVDLLLEARARLALARTAEAGRAAPRTRAEATADDLVPAALLQLDAEVGDVLLVDLGRSEMLRFDVRDGEPVLAARHYVSSGRAGFGKRVEGDLRTPLGVYLIESFHPDDVLPDLYGSGALTLDYPNALDRSLGRTGSGIWLHGVPHARSSRAPRSSEGCVSMSNDHLARLAATIDRAATIVVLADRVDWVTRARRDARLAALRRLAGPGGIAPGSTLVAVPGAEHAHRFATSAPPLAHERRTTRFVKLEAPPMMREAALAPSFDWRP